MIKKIFCLFLCGFIMFSVMPKPSIAAASSIIVPSKTYSYEVLTNDMKKLAERYPNLITYKSLGKTAYGREIWALKLGTGEANVLFNGAHHAREWLTTTLLMKMIEDYAVAFENNASIGSYPAKSILEKTSIWFIPMVNPDGVTLQQFGLGAFPKDKQNGILKANGNSYNFKRWKANAQGIDPNRQYPAGWSNITNNKWTPYYMNHKGSAPLEIPEARLLANFTRQIKPEIGTSYHSSGEIIYWHFHNKPGNYSRDKAIVDKIGSITGYAPVKPTSNPSGGGYTDWFIQEFSKPAFTIEISPYVGETHVPVSSFNSIWNKNKTVGLYLAQEGYKLSDKKIPDVPVESVNMYLELTETTTLFTQPTVSSNSSGSITPQRVHAVSKKGDWYQIETWLGLRWIKPKNPIQGEILSVNKTLLLRENTWLHSLPFNSHKGYAYLSPQTVKATKQWGDWFKVNTWLGEQWIYYPFDDIVNINLTIELERRVWIYSTPSTGSPAVSSVSPQLVTAKRQSGEWYEIETWLGPKWIHYPEAQAVGTNVEIVLKSTTTLHEYPSSIGKTIHSVGPQSLRSYKKMNGWYYVYTFVGPMWIKPVGAVIIQK